MQGRSRVDALLHMLSLLLHLLQQPYPTGQPGDYVDISNLPSPLHYHVHKRKAQRMLKTHLPGRRRGSLYRRSEGIVAMLETTPCQADSHETSCFVMTIRAQIASIPAYLGHFQRLFQRTLRIVGFGFPIETLSMRGVQSKSRKRQCHKENLLV